MEEEEDRREVEIEERGGGGGGGGVERARSGEGSISKRKTSRGSPGELLTWRYPAALRPSRNAGSSKGLSFSGT